VLSIIPSKNAKGEYQENLIKQEGGESVGCSYKWVLYSPKVKHFAQKNTF
jgi:hypothetical protein